MSKTLSQTLNENKMRKGMHRMSKKHSESRYKTSYWCQGKKYRTVN